MNYLGCSSLVILLIFSAKSVLDPIPNLSPNPVPNPTSNPTPVKQSDKCSKSRKARVKAHL